MAIEYTKSNETKKSTAAPKDVRRTTEAAHVASVADHKHGEVDGRTRALPAGTQALPVDTTSKALFDRSAYQRQYMADLRTIKRLGLSVTVVEWRKTNG